MERNRYEPNHPSSNNLVNKRFRMKALAYQNGKLYCEGVAIEEIAKQYKTPLYLYSASTLTQNYQDFDQGLGDLPHQVCFSVKSNGNLSILHLLSRLGSGADIVSGGELFKALQAGIPAKKIVYSGVGKTLEEIQTALEADILLFNIESEQELVAIQSIAQKLHKRAAISIRVNPNIDPKTHHYITTGLKENKFGLSNEKAISLYQQAKQMPELEIRGIACHIGSQLTSLQPYVETFDHLTELIQQLEQLGISLSYIDVGGGLGIQYHDENPPTPQAYGALIQEKFGKFHKTILLEPGRAICGNAGCLITKIIYVKETPEKVFYIVDAAMNDLIRPSFYQAYHEMIPLKEPQSNQTIPVDVVGPICESGDFLAKNRGLPLLEAGDLLLVQDSGAYGLSMSSNYNARPRAPEVLIREGNYSLIRKRETPSQLIENDLLFEI